MKIKIKIAELFLKYIEKQCNKHKGLTIVRYKKLDGTIKYKLEMFDC